MPVAQPPAVALYHLLGGFVRVTRRCEILDSSGETFYDDIGLIDGTVSVDASRDERRTLDITLGDSTGKLNMDIDKLWYDKLIRPWRGIEWAGGSWEAPLGTFMIDTIGDVTRIKRRHRPRSNDDPHFTDPATPFTYSCQITGRDFTKKMLQSKFPNTVTFVAGTALDVILTALAGNSGITAVTLPWSGFNPAPVLPIDQTFDADTPRWQAASTLCLQFGYEIFVDALGVLIVRTFRDPATLPAIWKFTTGYTEGNLVDYKLVANDTELFNHVVVRGSGATNALVFGEAIVTDPTSPVHPDRIGDRTYPYPSSVVASNAQAVALAQQILKVRALQSYEVQMDSIVLPWMEASEVVAFDDPDSDQDLGFQFFLSNFDIPLGTLGAAMPASAKRVLAVA